MDAADVLYGVTMGDDGVTKVVSRRLPREDASGGEVEDSASDGATAPPPFAGIAVDPAEAEDPASVGEAAPAAPSPARDSVEAA
jgi:hypothetical protein